MGRVLPVEGGGELTAGQLLESFGFPSAKQWTRVGELSGGERRRLQLLRLLLAGSNVLLLDEPTNDLDIETLRALEDVLDGWPGTLVVVTHDRYFLERVCDSVLALVGDGQLAALPGGVDEYLARRDAGEAGKPPGWPGPDELGGRSGQARRPAWPGRCRRGRAAGEARKRSWPGSTGSSQRLAARESELHEALAEAAADYARLIDLGDELRASAGREGRPRRPLA